MAILVLGGAGYIGSHTVYELIDAGKQVVIADNLETGHIEAVHPQNSIRGISVTEHLLILFLTMSRLTASSISLPTLWWANL